jgi:hypothetical protein
MNDKKLFLKTNKIGFVLGAALLAMFTGSVGNADAGVSIVIGAPPPVVVVAPPVVVVQDDYVYYPDYAVYYNSGRHQYAYLEGDAWIFALAPRGVTVEVLLASPSVHMDWHDSPANHHAEMMRKYPRDWQPAGEHHDVNEGRKDAGPDHDKKQLGQ